jgi:hypothetical protein
MALLKDELRKSVVISTLLSQLVKKPHFFVVEKQTYCGFLITIRALMLSTSLPKYLAPMEMFVPAREKLNYCITLHIVKYL